jgi:hypothetical protein
LGSPSRARALAAKISGAQFCASLGPPSVNDGSATDRAHARPETVVAFAFQHTGLVRPFHQKYIPDFARSTRAGGQTYFFNDRFVNN